VSNNFYRLATPARAVAGHCVNWAAIRRKNWNTSVSTSYTASLEGHTWRVHHTTITHCNKNSLIYTVLYCNETYGYW
jgi:hypothetical protein